MNEYLFEYRLRNSKKTFHFEGTENALAREKGKVFVESKTIINENFN